MTKLKLNKIDIRKLKDNVNLILYNMKGIGLNELKASNELCDKIGSELNKLFEEIKIPSQQ